MTDTDKFLKLFGTVFFSVGVLMLIISLGIVRTTGDFIACGGTLILSIVFGGVGGGLLIAQIKKRKERQKILSEGTRYTGKIHSYVEDKSCTMNGDYPINLNVHYFDHRGTEREAIIPTGFTKGSGEYPIGATIDIIALGTNYTWDKDSVRFERIFGEEELMDDKPLQHASMVGVSCKSCGASFSAAKGYVNKCPYCGGSINC